MYFININGLKSLFLVILNNYENLSHLLCRGFLLQKTRSLPFRKFNNKIYRNREMKVKNDYSRNYFWIIKDPETLKERFYLKPHGKLVEVNEDVFKVCYNSYKK